MEESLWGDVLVYNLGHEEGGGVCLYLSAEIPYVRVSVGPGEGFRLSLHFPPTLPRILSWLQSGSGSD